MAAAGLLGALYLLGAPAVRGELPSRARHAAAYALALVAATSFGFGTGGAAILPLLLLLLFPGLRTRRRLPPLASLLVVVPALYFGLVRLYSTLYGNQLDMAAWLTTQASAQGLSIALAFLRCVAFGASRLVFGVLVPPAVEPMWIAYAVAAPLLLAIAPWLEARRMAAWALLASVCYGIVAVTRTQYLVEGRADFLTALARYHYLGLVGLAMLLAGVLQRSAAALRPSPALADGLLAAWIAATVVLHFVRPVPLQDQQESRRQTEKTLAAMRAEIESRPRGEAVYIRNRNFPPLPAIAVPFALFPGWAAAFVVFHPENAVDGRRVYFVQRSPEVIEALARGRRTRDLFVTEAPRTK
jgi:hypothetical protein